MNNAINEIKNTLEGTNSRIMEAEDRISEVEDRMVEIKESEMKKGKRIKGRVLKRDLYTYLPWVGKILWRRKWQPTLVSLPGKSHGQRSLVGYSPRGHRKESDTT